MWRYPKDFKFTWWHPHCRCHAISILKTDEELKENTRRSLNGEEPDGDSVNRIDDVPKEFKDWLVGNAARLQYTSNVPYFLADNPQYSGIRPHFGAATGTKLGRAACDACGIQGI